jgi:hypothetical protein
LDERLVRAAVTWGLHPVTAFEEAADELVALAAGNRSAVERALRRVAAERAGSTGRRSAEPVDTTVDRAAAVLRLALARGSWAW